MAHSTIGASTCERWWNCPGSVKLIESLPPQRSSSYAAEGTAAHELAELSLQSGRDAVYYVDGFSKEGIEFTDEMAEAVQLYLDTVRFDMETYGLKPSDINIEHKFHLTSIDEAAFGTNDCSIPLFLDKLIVYDYKHGAGVAVDVEENKQLLYYALGAALEGEHDVIEMVIVQPRAVHRDGPVRRFSISMDELLGFATELRGKILRTREPQAGLNCGPWCKKTFCPAMAICPAIKQRVERDAMVVFEEPIAQLPKPDEITPLALRRLLDGMPLIEEWLKSVWAYCEQKANNGEKILGYKLVRGREGNRKWADETQADKELSSFNPAFAIHETRLISPAKVEKLDKKLKEVVLKLTTRSEGKIILVPEEDPREAVQPNSTAVFDQIE